MQIWLSFLFFCFVVVGVLLLLGCFFGGSMMRWSRLNALSLFPLISCGARECAREIASDIVHSDLPLDFFPLLIPSVLFWYAFLRLNKTERYSYCNHYHSTCRIFHQKCPWLRFDSSCFLTIQSVAATQVVDHICMLCLVQVAASWTYSVALLPPPTDS